MNSLLFEEVIKCYFLIKIIEYISKEQYENELFIKNKTQIITLFEILKKFIENKDSEFYNYLITTDTTELNKIILSINEIITYNGRTISIFRKFNIHDVISSIVSDVYGDIMNLQKRTFGDLEIDRDIFISQTREAREYKRQTDDNINDRRNLIDELLALINLQRIRNRKRNKPSDNNGSDNNGSDNNGSDNNGSDNNGSDNNGSDNNGSDNNGSDNNGSYKKSFKKKYDDFLKKSENIAEYYKKLLKLVNDNVKENLQSIYRKSQESKETPTGSEFPFSQPASVGLSSSTETKGEEPEVVEPDVVEEPEVVEPDVVEEPEVVEPDVVEEPEGVEETKGEPDGGEETKGEPDGGEETNGEKTKRDQEKPASAAAEKPFVSKQSLVARRNMSAEQNKKIDELYKRFEKLLIPQLPDVPTNEIIKIQQKKRQQIEDAIINRFRKGNLEELEDLLKNKEKDDIEQILFQSFGNNDAGLASYASSAPSDADGAAAAAADGAAADGAAAAAANAKQVNNIFNSYTARLMGTRMGGGGNTEKSLDLKKKIQHLESKIFDGLKSLLFILQECGKSRIEISEEPFQKIIEKVSHLDNKVAETVTNVTYLHQYSFKNPRLSSSIRDSFPLSTGEQEKSKQSKQIELSKQSKQIELSKQSEHEKLESDLYDIIISFYTNN